MFLVGMFKWWIVGPPPKTVVRPLGIELSAVGGGGGVGVFSSRNQQVTLGHDIKANGGRLVLGPFRILFLCVEG